jgi:hypothetical protein
VSMLFTRASLVGTAGHAPIGKTRNINSFIVGWVVTFPARPEA